MRRPDTPGDFPGAQSCPHCGSGDLRNFSANAHDETEDVRIGIYACPACDFAWQWPWPRSAESSSEYFASEYESAADGSYFDTERRTEIAAQQLAYVADTVGGPARLLDIGGGDGAFGEAVAAAGWDVTGVDPAMPAHKIGDGNPHFVRGFADDLPASEKFNVVTMWDVIEHLEDPQAVLQSAADRLLPGGYLFVETGNYQSAGRIETGEDWWCYQSDHRWYFTPPVLRRMMADAGLDDMHVHDRVLRPWWNGSCTTPAPGLAGLVKSSLRRPHKAIGNFRRHRQLVECARRWPDWNGLDIFTISARRK